MIRATSAASEGSAAHGLEFLIRCSTDSGQFLRECRLSDFLRRARSNLAHRACWSLETNAGMFVTGLSLFSGITLRSSNRKCSCICWIFSTFRKIEVLGGRSVDRTYGHQHRVAGHAEVHPARNGNRTVHSPKLLTLQHS